MLSVATVGNDQDSLNIETALGQEMSSFIAHFSCPAFAINEVFPAMTARFTTSDLSSTHGMDLRAQAWALCIPRGFRLGTACYKVHGVILIVQMACR